MGKWIVLLRGINVGGNNIIKMAELRSKLTSVGFGEVQTYIQSGNIVLDSKLRSPQAVSKKVEEAILDEFEIQTDVLTVSEKSFDKAIANNPYPKATADPKSLHVCFPLTKPKKPDWERADELKKDSEQYEFVDGVFYLHAPDGIGRSKLSASLASCLGVPVTGRNWRTMIKLTEMLGSNS